MAGFGKKLFDMADSFLMKIKIEKRRREEKTVLKKEVRDCPPLSEDEMQKCKAFWSRYPAKYDPDWCRFYKSKTGIFDPRFIPSDIQYADIDTYLNNWKKAETIDDKNYYSLLYSDVKQPNTVIRIINGSCFSGDYTPIDSETALKECKKHHKLIFKQSLGSCGGKNIFVWDSEKDSDDLLGKFFNNALSRKEYIVQEYLKQSPILSSIHPGSVNTMRINTLMIDNKVYFLSAILKMGAGDMVVDNVHWGGCSCGIDENGKLRKFGSDVSGNNIEKHPSGFVFEGFEVPGFFKAKDLVCKLQERLGNFRMVGWDIAIDENNDPVLIESNFCYSAINFQQWNNGPIFGDLTEKVLDEVYSSKKKK